MKKKLSIGLLAALTLTSPVWAQAVDEIVVSATGIPTPISQIGSSVDIITAEDLERQQITYLQDALRGLKGVTFDQEGTTGGLGNLRMRGMNRQNVVVFLDGVNLADAADANGGAEIANLLVGDIGRVEVMRGANSVLYGSNAVAGVVDMRSKKPGGGAQGSAYVKTGSNTLRQAGLGYEGSAFDKNLSYRVSLQSVDVTPPSELDEENTDYSEDEDYENITASGAFDLQLGEASNLYLLLRTVDSSADTDGFHPTNFSNIDGHFGVDTVQNLIRLSFDTKISEDWSLSLAHSFLGNHRDTFAEIGDTYFYDGERTVSEVRSRYAVNESHYVHFGSEQKTETLFQNGLPNEEEVETTALFAVWHGGLGVLNASLGLRQDDHETFGTHDSWRAGVTAPIDEYGRVRFNIGTGYRAPSLYELFGRDSTCIYGLCGNTDLQPEETISRDIGFIVTPKWSPLIFELGYFSVETENRIFYENVGPPSFAGNYKNDSGESKFTGSEMSLELPLGERMSLRVDYSHLNPRKADGTVQDSQPRRLLGMVASYQSADGLSDASFTLREVRDRYRSGTRQEDYVTAGFAYNYRFRERLTLQFGGDNIFDEHYRTAARKSAPRRSFTLGLTTRF